MKTFIRLSIILAALIPFSAGAKGLDDLLQGLRNIDCYRADARFTVMMPQQPDDVVYDLSLTSTPAAGDRYAPCDYLIDWTLNTPSGPTTGFGAYFDGHHYRYRTNRLQEYHVDWDSVPFMPRGVIADGVQQRVQFANLLPAFIANEIESLSTNPDVTFHAAVDTVVSGNRCSIVTAERFNDGTLVQRACYSFDATYRPVKIETDNNLGALSEQTIEVKYKPAGDDTPECGAWNEQMLIDRYPDAFARFRENNFRVENLPGTRLPQFSLPGLDGSRYSHAGDDRFASPMVIAIINPEHGYSADLIAALRQAIDNMSVNADLMLTFVSNNADLVNDLVGTPRPGETILTSARSLARDLGVAECPVVLLVGTDATVSEVILGFNNDIANVVIQKMALVK